MSILASSGHVRAGAQLCSGITPKVARSSWAGLGGICLLDAEGALLGGKVACAGPGLGPPPLGMALGWGTSKAM